jgi:hypothetical protein
MMYSNNLSSLVQPRDPNAVPTLSSISGMAGYSPPSIPEQTNPSVTSGYDPNAPQSFPTTPAPAFVYGSGGAHLTKEQLDLRQKAALAAMQPDYSPIQSPWQGLARVAGNIVGALDEKKLDKQAAAAQADHQKTVAALLGDGSGGMIAQGSGSPVAAALLSDDPEVQKLGMAQWERDHPKPVNNDSAQDWAFYQQNLTPDQFEQWKANKVYNPPHFAIIDGAPAMVGGYQPPAADQGPPPPATLPADFDFGDK